MRKLYLLTTLLCLKTVAFATTWYSQGGAVNTLTNWTLNTGGTGGSPSVWTNAADVWVVQTNMTIGPSITWTIAGSLQLNSSFKIQKSGAAATTINVGNGLIMATGTQITTGSGGAGNYNINVTGGVTMNGTSSINHQGSGGDLTVGITGSLSMSGSSNFNSGDLADVYVNVGGNLSMSGSSYFYSAGSGTDYINIGGNLSVTGTAYFDNLPDYNYITFNNTSSTVASPQTITWTSTATSYYTGIAVNSGCVLQLNSNVPMPNSSSPAGGFAVNGTLVCGTNQLTSSTSNSFTLASGASIYTANTSGLNGSISSTFSRTFSGAANYVYNGVAAQVTGGYLPNTITSGGSVTINNTAGVSLSGTSTTFNSGSTLKLQNGILTNTATSLVMNSGSNVECDNGHISTVPSIYSGVNLTYKDLGTTALAVTTGNEWPATFTGSVTVNKTSAIITLNEAKALTGNLTLTNGSLDASSTSNYNLSLTGNWSNTSGTTGFLPRLGTVTFNGSSAQSILGSSATQFYNLTTTNTSGLNVTFNTDVTGTLNLNGTSTVINPSATAVFNNSMAAGTITGTGTIKVTRTAATADYVSQYKFATHTLGSTTVDFSAAGAQTINASSAVGNYGTITMTGSGTKTLGGAVMANNAVTIGSTATLDVSTSNYAISVGGDWTNSGTFTSRNGTVTFTASSSKTINGGVTGTNKFYNIAFNGTGSWVFPGANADVANDFTITAGSVTAPATLLQVGGSWNNGGSFGHNNGTVSMTATTTGKTLTGNMTGTNGFKTLQFNSSTGGWTMGSSVDVAGDMKVLAGSLTGPTSMLQVAGNFQNSATYNHNGGAVALNGTSAQSINGTTATTFNNLTLNNISGASLTAADTRVNGLLTLTAGRLTLGTYNLTFGPTATVGGTLSSSNMINQSSTGQVKKEFSSAGSFGFPIGEGGNYTPATLAFTGGTFGAGAYAAVTVTGAKHPNNGNTTDYINRYWTVGLSGITSPIYSATATYVPADVVGTESNISMARYTGSLPWVKDAATNTSTHTLSSGIATGPVSFSGLMSAPPTATVTATSATVCAGSTTTLSASATGDAPFTYTWAASGGTLSTTAGTTVIATPAVVGTVTYTVTVTDVNGFTNTATAVVTVTPAPAISGASSVCGGSTTTLSSTVSGGTWSSLASVATAGPGGEITGITAGTATVSYAVTGCPVATKVVTVLPTPAAIGGIHNTCEGSTTTLTDATTGGTWSSSNTAVGTIGLTSGVVTGILAGTTTITYRAGGCNVTAVVTVDTLPAPITGTFVLCGGLATTLSHPLTGGTWSSSLTSVAAIGTSTGVVTGGGAGTATIRYAVNATCKTNGVVMTVNSSPAVIGGVASVCLGNYTTLTETTAGGTWSTSNGAIATVTAGVVYGAAVGTATISYTISTGCSRAVVVTVHALPSAITGSASVCQGSTSPLSSTPGGGTWSSSNSAVIGVGVGTGVIIGGSLGTASITYTATTGCKTWVEATSNPLPSTISGTMAVCQGSTTALSNSTAGGTWTSSNTAVGTIDASSGVAAGITTGTTTISYTVVTGCYRAITLTVNAVPGTIAGPSAICEGSSIVFSSSPVGGTWSSSDPTAATAITMIGTNGLVTGVGAGTTMLTYILPTGCIATTTITVNPLAPVTTGTLTVCPGETTTLSNSTPGGTWSSSNLAVATVDATGVVTGGSAGTTIISYTQPLTSGGCSRTSIVTVYPTPAVISGPSAVCEGATVNLTDASAGGAWSIIGTPGVASVNAGTGVVTGIMAGTTTVAYTVATGCKATFTMSVQPTPAAISGTTTVCVGSTQTLTDATPGGVWSTSTPSIASIFPPGGIITGMGAGTSTISYTLSSTGCRSTTVVTVNGLPGSITGVLSGCESTTTTLSSSTTGGTWSSSNTAVATVNSAGVVSNITAGTSIISYTMGTGCQRTVIVTVNPIPASITGPTNVCESQTITMSSATTGGTWMASNSNAVISLTTHIVTGLIAGTSNITYTLPTGCKTWTTINIDQLPAAITGIPSLCPSTTTTLSSTTVGGTWSSSNPGIATTSLTAGVISAMAPGTTSITYTAPNGCYVKQTVTVNTLPTGVGGTLTVCTGASTTLNNSTGGGVWSSSVAGVATVTPTTAIVTGLTAGTTTITYTVGTGCIRTAIVTVNNSPAPISGASSICSGLTTTLTNSTTGGVWLSSDAAVAPVGFLTGVVSGVVSGPVIITYRLPNTCTATTPISVLQSPGPITGSNKVCVASTVTLGNTISAGTWTNSPTTTATIDATSGELAGLVAGTTVVTYTLMSGCQKTATITVNPLPAAITGTPAVCPGTWTTLSNITPGGGWSPTAGPIAFVTAGVLYGGTSTGTVTVSYTLPTGCRSTVVATVNPIPSILGTPIVCLGQSTSLTATIPGGTWYSNNPPVATVSASGVVDGFVNGSAGIVYTAPSGCTKTLVVSVAPTPAVITSAPTVCKNASTTASTTTTGGTWSSSNPSKAFVALTTGVITGLDTGIVNISYTSSLGCFRTTTIQVLPLPAPITGPATICAGNTATLTNDSLGGTWSMSHPAATIDASTGVLTTSSAGIPTITYQLPTGCKVVKQITVNPIPAAITGSANICQGSTVTLSNTTPGGSWSSSTPLIASVPTTPGHVSGLGLGTATITYRLSTGCQRTTEVTVNPVPDAITGTMVFCAGTSTTLSNTTPGGTWSSGNPAIATAVSTTGVINGVTGGTALITYKLAGTGCISMTVITVNAAPSFIGGATHVCEGSATMLTNTQPGGIWTSTNPAVALINSVGNVSGITVGTATITYALTTGCFKTTNVTVQPTPAAITGTMSVCAGSTTVLSSTTPGGVWTSGHPSVATIGGPGIVTGISGGTAIMSYTLGTGCYTTQMVTVNTVPAAILGTGGLCVGSSLTLNDATPGGTWSSTSTATATVGTGNGIVTGVANGTVEISYTLATGCAATTVVSVYAMPTAITGIMNICAGTATTFANATTGGTWTSSNTSIATVGSTTGIVTAIVPGTSNITYVLPFGCRSTATVTVSPFAAPITGITNICEGATSTLNNLTPGGTWSSGSTAVASVDVSSGVVTGVAAGSTLITYTTTSGCFMTTLMLVTPTPSTITGVTVVCANSSVTLSNSVGGGLWSSGDTSVATVMGIGSVTGVSAGTVNITYSLGACFKSTTVTVNPAPPAIGGFTSVCTQMTTLLTNSTAGGTWSSSNPAVAPIDATGTVSGLSAGTSMVTYRLTEGCYATATIVVNTAPRAAIDIHPTGDLCSNTMYQNIGTSTGMPAGVLYTWNAINATINFVSPDKRNCIISFLTPGTSLITLKSQVTSTGCVVTDSLITNVTTAVSPTPSIVYYSPQLVCSDYTADSYQWGYDDQATFDSTLYPGEVNQDLMMPTLDLINKAYWVITTHQGCMQKTYYNRPTAVSGAVRTITFVNLYPNPANTNITIEAGNEDIEVKLFDMVGQSLLSTTLTKGKGTLDVSKLAAGTYSAVLFSNGEKVAVKTFVKN